jgi:type I restriction enzyme S subunit
MFTDLKPYPEYRDSQQPWIGSVPSSWRVTGARAIFAEVGTAGHEDAEMLSVTIGRGVIRQDDLLAGSSKKDSSNLDRSKYKFVEPGDITYNKMRAWQGAVGISHYRGIVSPAYVVVRPRLGVGAYFHHLLRTPSFAKEAERWSYGITSDQWSLRPEHFKMIYLPLPSDHEQAAIVKYLGHANARIDRAIAAKRKLIALLEEQRQAVINQAVTRGLDSSVPLADSGVAWLGPIPAHWRMPMLGQCLRRIEQGWSPSAAEGEIGADQWAVLSLSAVDRGTFKATAIKPIPYDRDIPTAYELIDGDLLMTRSNTRLRVGDVAIARDPRPRTIISDLIYRLSPRSEIVARRYLAIALRSPVGRRQIEQDARGSSGTMPKISQTHIRSWRIPIPPLGEQIAIATDVGERCVVLDETVARARSEIDLLREFRTRLTADVVTGQLDVREVAAGLPDLDPADLAGDVGADVEDDLDTEAAEFLEDVDA